MARDRIALSLVVFGSVVGAAACSSSETHPAPDTSKPTPVGEQAKAPEESFDPTPASRGASNRRPHESNQRRALSLVPADSALGFPARVQIEVEGEFRVLRGNGAPNHHVGSFPNRGNPHAIEEQSYEVKVPAKPSFASSTTPLGNHNFGFAINGVPFDPGAAEFYLGDRNTTWQYEALGGAVPLGIDENHAHVQPTGAYHYHGLPTQLLDELGVREGKVSPVIGWAADGFPIYALYGPSDPEDASSPPTEYGSSYVLREGQRPGGEGHPGGTYDGTFVADYRYVAGKGELDECNGRTIVTADFPQGSYAYFLSRDWPVIPRCYRGTPHPSVIDRGPGAGAPPRRPGQPPGGGPRPGRPGPRPPRGGR
ncbi:MAG: YHYH protein [Myxococcota bacterium]